MSIDTGALDLLNSSGGASAKFPIVGTTVKGTIVSAEKKQQTDFDTGEPLTWDNGDPRWQVIFTLATDEHDPDNAEDDGTRRLYAKGIMLSAIQRAIRESGDELAEGGTLAVQYTGDGEAKKRGMSPPKLYSAQYKGPAAISPAVKDLI